MCGAREKLVECRKPGAGGDFQIEDDAGQYGAAYQDYKQALAIKPDYAPAQRQLARFKVVPTQ